MPVITVSGSLFGGAREVAQAVAAHMQLDYVDREILAEAAGALGVPVAAVEDRDERPSGFGERLAGVLRNLMERSAAAGAADPLAGGGLEMVLARTYGEAAELPEEADRGQLDDQRYLKTLKAVINGIAARGNVVILGRGSQMILHDASDVTHVYAYLPRQERIELMAEREGIPLPDAEKRIKRSDDDRSAFYRRYFKHDVGSPDLYDIVVHLGRVSTELAVKLISDVAHERTPRPG